MAGKEESQIFVGGLSWCTTERTVEGAFRRFGKIVHVQVITERHTGRSRGFGFVIFSDPRAAIDAIMWMHNQELDGHTITVFWANPKVDNADGGRDGYCGSGRAAGFGGGCCFACGRPGHWAPDCPDAGRCSGRFSSDFTVRGGFFFEGKPFLRSSICLGW
ncbi:glycine-rich RNA-binding protein RZ1C [Brachypodium distachyon]|uniref:glycine-rich RNA-binding protein RZ1C n=1 Tax=Brachypodium distachyon TaxID=15368 RepID=UPI0001C752E8|nr:glycine-rich RNA-binding protein RZ1C [Brachypodium distachyon]|eukprot:XP_003559579.1 glycine-rich RNA-binding protein RZ1C [Brachypodium distachyon]